MKANITLTETAEIQLLSLKKLAVINNINASNKEIIVNFAIDVAYKCVTSLDEDSLKTVAGLNKSI